MYSIFMRWHIFTCMSKLVRSSEHNHRQERNSQKQEMNFPLATYVLHIDEKSFYFFIFRFFWFSRTKSLLEIHFFSSYILCERVRVWDEWIVVSIFNQIWKDGNLVCLRIVTLIEKNTKKYTNVSSITFA